MPQSVRFASAAEALTNSSLAHLSLLTTGAVALVMDSNEEFFLCLPENLTNGKELQAAVKSDIRRSAREPSNPHSSLLNFSHPCCGLVGRVQQSLCIPSAEPTGTLSAPRAFDEGGDYGSGGGRDADKSRGGGTRVARSRVRPAEQSADKVAA